MVKFYLGRPPYKIEEWIKSHMTSKLSDPLCFTAQQANSTIILNGDWSSSSGSSDHYSSNPYGGGGSSTYKVNLEYKLEGTTTQDWTRYIGQFITLANVNDKMYMRAMAGGNTTISFDSNYYNFEMNGKIAASGNIQTLLDQTGKRMDVPEYCYKYMFMGCTSLTKAPELPATTLANNCYYSMFRNCTSLTQAPVLPATTLTNYCYEYMFSGCTSLTKAPELPATTLANCCYNQMFYNCKSLTTAPELPSKTLADYCYQQMFYGCASLTIAPELPATTLASYCYNGMFGGCTSLTIAPELPATTLAYHCYVDMFYECPLFSSVKMKVSMNGVYNTSTHGDIKKTVEYVL